MRKNSIYVLAILSVVLFIWLNLYQYQSTDKIIYRTNIITHQTEYLYGNNEWQKLIIKEIQPAEPAGK